MCNHKYANIPAEIRNIRKFVDMPTGFSLPKEAATILAMSLPLI